MHILLREVLILSAHGLQPALDGVVVMGADIADAVELAAVRQIVGVAVGVKGELKHLHSGQTGVGQQLLHAGGDITQVFCNVFHVTEPGGEHTHQVHARAGEPFADFGAGRVGRHGPVAVKAPEMVDTDHVKELFRPADTADPPAEAVLGHAAPVIQRVAPELAVLGKGIGRNACHSLGQVFLVQLEKLGLAPHVGGVHGHIDGHVADEADAFFGGVSLQRIPLLIEQILEENIEIHIVLELPAVFRHGLRAAEPDILVRPLDPADHVEVGLHRHEQGVIFQPAGVLFPERGNLMRILFRPSGVSQAEHREAELVDPAVIHFGRIVAPIQVLDLGGLQQAVLDQHVKVNEVGVARKAGEGGIGAVPVAGGAKGQELPVFLTRGLEKVHKFIGAFSQCADSVIGGQGAHGHKNTAASFHVKSTRFFLVLLLLSL